MHLTLTPQFGYALNATMIKQTETVCVTWRLLFDTEYSMIFKHSMFAFWVSS
jgi:hypothetical protein